MLERKIFVKRKNWILAVLMDMVGNLIFIKRRKILPQKPKKIIILRTDGIGDTLLTTPFIKSLKELYPDLKIDLFIRPSSKGILEDNSNISNIHISNSLWCDLIRGIRLRKEKYDVVISPRTNDYIFNHLIAFIVGSSRRIGYAMRGGSFLLTDVVPWYGERSFIQLMMGILKTIDQNNKYSQIEKNEKVKIEFKISKDDVDYADNLLKQNGMFPKDIIIGINPFASHQLVWPATNFIQLVNNLSTVYGAKIVFIGDNKSKAKIEKIRKDISVSTISLAGRTNLKQLAALIKWFKLLITNDSGPRHIANSVKTPVIVLRNLANSNVVWGKYCDTEHLIFRQVPCAPCGKSVCPENKRICMTQITQEDVLTTVKRVIGESIAKPT
jgi:heptosyltransferase-2